MKADEQFRLTMGLAIIAAGTIAVASIFLYTNFLMAFGTFLLIMLLLSTFEMVAKMKCRNPLALYNESITAQRDVLAWYVSNAMHEYKSPAYHEIVVAALYDKGKTFITDLAKILQLAEDESRENLVVDIQNQLGEWELILNQLRERIDEYCRKIKNVSPIIRRCSASRR